ncbi:carbohydrate-binding module family 13 protein [Postia placenta MAD-698-R-SB12]|uniref:Carbohydrate-binding module family 13 protein n=1 Tax=Postia placenta MAD-698-R-SB12 TaxID=670580 RepID=A0A1X6N880_9APHY|nr:carbohydrate-binding module family 13 protein [Postia placenta MAD-698-R-SB12]OSX64835.1 carbohydrate-binding module family 13 protein [Postia placenta MAD-698-R-SB12]
MAEVDLFFTKGVFKIQAGGVRIKNIDTNTYFDLYHGLSSENNPVIGFEYNGTDAQLWTVQIVDESKGHVKLLNAAGGTYARAPDHIIGGRVVGSNVSETFKVSESGGKVQITVINEDYAFSLANAANHEQVKLTNPDGSKNNQLWSFQKV